MDYLTTWLVDFSTESKSSDAAGKTHVARRRRRRWDNPDFPVAKFPASGVRCPH